MFDVCSNFVSNLIIILFNHFLVFFVEFNVRVECESFVKTYEEGEFTIGSRLVHK